MAEKRHLQLDCNQQLVTQPQPMVAQPQPMMIQTQPMLAQSQPVVAQPQAVMIQLQRPPAKRYTSYKTVRSRMLGIIQITCGVLAVFLNAVGIGLHDRIRKTIRDDNYNRPGNSRGHGDYYWHGSMGYNIAAPFWSLPMFCVCGAFAIVAANRPTRCPIITCQVLSIISMVLSVIMVAMSTWALADDSERLHEGFTYVRREYAFRNSTFTGSTPPPVTKTQSLAIGPAKGCIVLSFLYLCVSVTELVACAMLCAISGQVICADDTQEEDGRATQVQYMASQQGQPQILILDHHGRPLTDTQMIQMPGPSTVHAEITSQALSSVPQMAAPAAAVAPTEEVVAPVGQLINVQPPSYAAEASQNQPSSQSGDNSPPPPYQ